MVKMLFGQGRRASRSMPGHMRISRSEFFSPLAVIGGLTLLVLTLGIHFSVRAFDAASATREQTLAGNGMARHVEEVAHSVIPQTQWDDAVRHLDNSFDHDWADANIGKYFYQTDGFDRSFVLDRDNRPIFAAINGELTANTSFRRLAPLADPLVRAVRQMETKRGPIPAGVSKTMVSRPIQASAFTLIDGQMAIMTATLVQPDFGTATLAGPRAPIVVTTTAVNAGFLKEFSDRFLFKPVRVRALDEAPFAGEIQIPAKDDQGRTIAWFAWQPLDPGYAMLRHLLPPIALVCLILGVVAYTQLRRISRLANELVESEAHARALAYYDPTTGLPNRLYFREQLALEISGLGDYHPSLAVHNLSFDGLADIAESFGVAAREEYVSIAAKRLAATCRDNTVIARTSDISFAILSLDAGVREARALSDRLDKAMNKPIALESGRMELPCSVTVQIVTDALADADEVLHQAEIAALEDGGALRVATAH